MLSFRFTASSAAVRARAIIYFVAFLWPVFPIGICDTLTEFPGTARRWGLSAVGSLFSPLKSAYTLLVSQHVQKLSHPRFSSTFPPVAFQIAFRGGRSTHHKKAVTSVADK